LKPDGLIFPDKATIHLAFIEDADYKRQKLDFWDNVYGFNMSCIKSVAYKEPLVDVVESKTIVSKSACVYTLDLYTIKVEELEFESNFNIEFDKDDYVHALISWFDIEFNSCTHPVRFSTSPYDKYTHWKQTVFYLEDVLSVSKGERVNGSMKCTRNRSNPREYDIQVRLDFEGAYSSLHVTHQYHLK